MTQCPIKFWLVILMLEHVSASWRCWACDVALDVTYMPGAGDEFTMGRLWFFWNSSSDFPLEHVGAVVRR